VNVTGASSLRFGSKIPAEEMPKICKRLLEIYEKDDFRISFPDIQNIVPVKDPVTCEILNERLVNALKEDDRNLVLAVPEIIEENILAHFTFSGCRRKSEPYEDAYLYFYKEYLGERGFSLGDISIEYLKRHKLELNDDNGNIQKVFSVYRTLIYDCEYDDLHYHLHEGDWYQVDKDYMSGLRKELDPVFIDKHVLLSDCTERKENAYNVAIAIASKSESAVCLDGKSIAPRGQTAVEPCDVYYVDGDTAQLVHIKISTRSSALSHLFNQGFTSMQLLRINQESNEKLNELISDCRLHNPIDEEKYEVVYGIITNKPPEEKSKNLPLFSQISLVRTIRDFKTMGIPCAVVCIRDRFDRKGIK
jgi:uncharacterized protein (TIGR04141 family)